MKIARLLCGMVAALIVAVVAVPLTEAAAQPAQAFGAGTWRGTIHILDSVEVPVDFLVTGPTDSLAIVIRIRAGSNVEGFQPPRYPARNVRLRGDTLSFEFDGPGAGDQKNARCTLVRAPQVAFAGSCSASVHRAVIRSRISTGSD